MCRGRSLSFLFICSRAFTSGKKSTYPLLPFCRYRPVMIDFEAWRPWSFDCKYPASHRIEMKLSILSIYAARILGSRGGSSNLDICAWSHLLRLRWLPEGWGPIFLRDLYANRVVIVLLMCCLFVFDIVLFKFFLCLRLFGFFLLDGITSNIARTWTIEIRLRLWERHCGIESLRRHKCIARCYIHIRNSRLSWQVYGWRKQTIRRWRRSLLATSTMYLIVHYFVLFNHLVDHFSLNPL